MNDRILYYWLAREGHTGKLKYDALINAYGSLPEAYSAIFRGKYANSSSLTLKYCERLRELADEGLLIKEMNEMSDMGISMTCLADQDYPEKLLHIYSAPVCLFYRGTLPASREPAIAVVGARACTPRGRHLAEKTAYELARAGVNVISGLAMGTDAAAHTGALKCSEGGKTFAILGCGVDRCYPYSNMEIYNEMCRRGGIISEFVPGTAPLRTNFPQRNRIISGLSDGILVTEARVKSGSLITADMGLDQGKNIYAFPGIPDDPASEGTNRLIQLGAKLVRNTDDIIEDFHIGIKSILSDMPQLNLRLESREKIVYDTLCLIPQHITEIMKEAGLSQNELFSVLLSLELKGYVERTSFEYYIAAPEYWRGPA